MRCYLCNSDANHVVSEKLRYESPRKVYSCDNCGLVYLYPQMTPEEERVFYEKEYGEIYSSEKGTTPAQLFTARQADARQYLDWVTPYIGREDDCLEIGCASGYFLDALRPLVRSVSGTETHTILNKYCTEIGIPMYGSLAECGDAQFDKVFMFFVLEHLGDPALHLKEIRRILKNDGSLIIVVPNIGDALFSLYDIPAFRSFYFTPAHQFYYSRTTLRQLLGKNGFGKIEILPKQRYDLSNHMHWMQFGKPGGVGKYDSVFSEALRSAYGNDLCASFRCDTLFAVAGGIQKDLR